MLGLHKFLASISKASLQRLCFSVAASPIVVVWSATFRDLKVNEPDQCRLDFQPLLGKRAHAPPPRNLDRIREITVASRPVLVQPRSLESGVDPKNEVGPCEFVRGARAHFPNSGRKSSVHLVFISLFII